jgi:hypothetical protein
VDLMKLFWPPNRNREGSDSQNQLFWDRCARCANCPISSVKRLSISLSC